MSALSKLIEVMISDYDENNRTLDKIKNDIPLQTAIELCQFLKKDLGNIDEFIEKIDFDFLNEMVGSVLYKRLLLKIDFIGLPTSFATTKEEMASLLDEIIENLDSKLSSENNINYEELNEYNDKLHAIIKTIQDKLPLNKEDFKFIVNYIKEMKYYNKNEKKEMIIAIGNYLLENIEYTFEEIVSIEKNDITLSVDELREVFDRFNYGILVDIAVEKHKKQLNTLVEFGKIDNIFGILECFNKLGISSVELKERVPQLFEILLRSNAKNVDTIISIIKEDILEDKVDFGDKIQGTLNEKIKNLLINYYMKTPTIFVESNQILASDKKGRKNGSNGVDERDIFSGTMRNYIENRKTLFKIPGFKLKLDSFSTLQVLSPRMFNYNLETLYKYGLDEKVWFDALSVFRASSIEEKLDLCIELGLYDYVRENPSFLVTMKPLSLYRVKYYNVNSGSNSLLDINGKRVGLKQEVTNPHKIWGLEQNGPEETDVPYIDDQMKMISSYCKALRIKNGLSLDLSFDEKIKDDIFSIRLDKSEYSYNKMMLINQLIGKKFDDIFKVNEREYSFNGVIISRIKVLRNLRAVLEPFIKSSKELPNAIFNRLDEILLYCVTRKSILTEDEFNIIKDCISQRDNIYSDRRGK